MYLVLLYLILGVISVKSEEVFVETTNGVIIGDKNNGVTSFYGVPYALVKKESPFGGVATIITKSKTPFVANNNTIICYQRDADNVTVGVKQCLTLNIFVPQSEHVRLPVLVWFHGESFMYGDANNYRSSHLVKEEIIFISVNFRLGIYGFMCAKEYYYPGNQAIKDQLAALKWIQRNIQAFNGNPTSVTIAGSNFGAGYVDLHMYNQMDRLFDKAIIQSGSIFTDGFFVKQDARCPISTAKLLSMSIGRHTTSMQAIKYLSYRKPMDILKSEKRVIEEQNFCISGICKEVTSKDNAVTRNPFRKEIQDNVVYTKILAGFNSMELLSKYARNNTVEYYTRAGDIIYKILEKRFRLHRTILERLVFIIKRYYFGDKDYGPDTLVNLTEALSDFSVTNGVERSINRFVNAGATVYKYVFSYTGASEYSSIPGSGAPQAEELKFLLNWKTDISGPEQETIRATMVKLWSNFIKFGNPTPGHEPLPWEPLQGLSRPYLNIDSTISIMNDNFHHQRNAFWHLFWYEFQKFAYAYY